MSILDDAVAFWRVSDYSGSGDLLDGSGNSHDAAITGARFLKPDPMQYVYFPGLSGNYLSSPHASPLNISGSIDIRGRVFSNDWTPPSNTQMIVSKDDVDERSWQFFLLNVSGLLRFIFYQSDSPVVVDSTVAPTVSDGNWLWVRVARNSVTGDVTFYTGGSGPEPSWAQLGDVVSAASGAMDTTIAEIEIGSYYSDFGSQWDGGISRVQIYDGIGGTLVFDADMTDPFLLGEPFSTFKEKSSNEATVTINRATSGLKTTVVDRPLFLLGTDDYLTVTDHADLDCTDSDDITVVGLFRRWGSPSSSQWLVCKKASFDTADAGYGLYAVISADTWSTRVSDGTSAVQPAIPASSDGFVHSFGMVIGSVVAPYRDGVPSSTGSRPSNTLANGYPLRIGAAASTPAFFLDGEFFGAAIFRRVLSAPEIQRASHLLLGGTEERLTRPTSIITPAELQ